MTFEFIASIVAAFAVNVVAKAIQLISEWRDARRKLKEAEETRFYAALEADSLTELGRYLDGPVGSFLVSEYADNPKVKHRVNTFLARLEEFVGKAGEVARYPQIPVSVIEAIPEATRGELQDVETRLQEGRPWDALALLRRKIERRLLKIAREHDLRLPEKPGAGRLLQLLLRHKLVPSDVGTSLRYAIDVANRGVHGLDVSTTEAFEALQHAQRALAAVRKRRPQMP